jgi:hypothetical protein
MTGGGRTARSTLNAFRSEQVLELRYSEVGSVTATYLGFS